MEEETAAFVYKIAPQEKPGEWSQKALKHVLSDWESTRPEDFDQIIHSENFGMVVGFNIIPGALGQYGYDTDYHFTPDIEEHLLDEVSGGHLAHEFYSDWTEELQAVIQNAQERTMFSAKEFAVFFAHQHPRRGEKKNADALGVTVGTYRGKVGRVKSKIETAEATLQLSNEYPSDISYEDWKRHTYEHPLSVLHRVGESELPVNAISYVDNDGITIHDLPLDELLKNQ